jgi:hypothetical protein
MNARLSLLAVAAVCFGWVPTAFPASIVNVSITRSLSADALAGGDGLGIITGSITGRFNETRTDADSSSRGTARSTAFQDTTLTVTDNSLEFTGAAYARSTADGSVGATTSSTASISFELSQLGFFTVTGTFVKSEAVDWEFDTNISRIYIYQIRSDGSSPVFGGANEGTQDGSTNTRTDTRSLPAGKYRIDLLMRTELSFPDSAPQALDVTAAASSFRVTVISVVPEPSTAAIVLTGFLAFSARSVRRKFALRTRQA